MSILANPDRYWGVLKAIGGLDTKLQGGRNPMWVVPLAHWWTRLIIRWTDVFWQTGAIGSRFAKGGFFGLGEALFDGSQVV